MTWLFPLQIIAAGLAAALAFIAIQSAAASWTKTLALVLCAGLIGVGYAGLAQLLGRPKPLSLSLLAHSTARLTVAGALMRENKAIYLWLLTRNNPQPIAYVLPWSGKTARRLRKARQRARQLGTGVTMARNLKPGNRHGKWLFYATPPAPLPPKK